jgi:hypothetical protein
MLHDMQHDFIDCISVKLLWENLCSLTRQLFSPPSEGLTEVRPQILISLREHLGGSSTRFTLEAALAQVPQPFCDRFAVRLKNSTKPVMQHSEGRLIFQTRGPRFFELRAQGWWRRYT